MTAKIETAESNWLFALPVDGLTLKSPIACAAARSAASGLEVAVEVEVEVEVLIGQHHYSNQRTNQQKPNV